MNPVAATHCLASDNEPLCASASHPCVQPRSSYSYCADRVKYHVCNMFSTACLVSARARWLLHCLCLQVLSLASLPTAVASGHLTGIAVRHFREAVLHSGSLKGLGLEIRKSVNPLKKLSRDSQIWGGVMSPPKSRAAPLQKF